MALDITVEKIVNAPESQYLGMQNFMAIANKYGSLAKSARFIVRFLGNNIGMPDIFNDLTYLCDSAEFPGRGFTQQAVRYYGPEFRIPVSTEYEDLTLSVLVRNDFQERLFFDNWMNQVQPIDQYNFNYRKSFVRTIQVYQMSDYGDPAQYGKATAQTQSISVPAKYVFVFEDAWPVTLQPTPVTWADDNIHRLTIQFTFRRWHKDQNDVVFPSFDLPGQGGSAALPPKPIVPGGGDFGGNGASGSW